MFEIWYATIPHYLTSYLKCVITAKKHPMEIPRVREVKIIECYIPRQNLNGKSCKIWVHQVKVVKRFREFSPSSQPQLPYQFLIPAPIPNFSSKSHPPVPNFLPSSKFHLKITARVRPNFEKSPTWPKFSPRQRRWPCWPVLEGKHGGQKRS